MNSPLEQFDIIPLICLKYNNFDFSITNEVIILLLSFFIISIFLSSLLKLNSDFYIIPTKWQVFLEFIYKVIFTLIIDNINIKQGQVFFPLVFTVFLFIISLNIIGLIPYSFTLTSHFIITFNLSFFLFLGINIIGIRLHRLRFFSLFLPTGTSIILTFLLVPIELVSYVFKPISLAIRLFVNLMAGHTLLKIITCFTWILMNSSGLLFFIHYIPLLFLIPLFSLELVISFIQAYIFSTLFCIYLNDAVNLH